MRQDFENVDSFPPQKEKEKKKRKKEQGVAKNFKRKEKAGKCRESEKDFYNLRAKALAEFLTSHMSERAAQADQRDRLRW